MPLAACCLQFWVQILLLQVHQQENYLNEILRLFSLEDEFSLTCASSEFLILPLWVYKKMIFPTFITPRPAWITDMTGNIPSRLATLWQSATWRWVGKGGSSGENRTRKIKNYKSDYLHSAIPHAIKYRPKKSKNIISDLFCSSDVIHHQQLTTNAQPTFCFFSNRDRIQFGSAGNQLIQSICPSNRLFLNLKKVPGYRGDSSIFSFLLVGHFKASDLLVLLTS